MTTEQGRAVAQKMNARYMECSSKEMTGVDEIFQVALEVVVANDAKNQAEAAAKADASKRKSRMGRNESIDVGGGVDGIPIVKKKKRSCKIL